MGGGGGGVIQGLMAFKDKTEQELGNAVKNPLRTAAAIGTLGASELFMAGKKSLIDDPKAQAEDAAKRQVDAQNQVIAQQAEIDRQGELANERSKQRAQQLSTSRAGQGRAGTILTSPLGLTSMSSSTGGKTLLGS